jgi:hypothetical protein
VKGKEMKRYFLFAGMAYESAGGMSEFIGDYDSMEDAKNVLAGIGDIWKEWWCILDTQEGVYLEGYDDDNKPNEWKPTERKQS